MNLILQGAAPLPSRVIDELARLARARSVQRVAESAFRLTGAQPFDDLARLHAISERLDSEMARALPSGQLTLLAGATDADEILDELELSGLAERRAGDIFYGDQRRVDIALALIGQPSVVLLDEPAAGLSIQESLALSRLLKGLTKRRGVTVLIVEHDMEVIFSICDRITVLASGRTLAEGNAAEIQGNAEVVRAYLGSAAA